ncbi:putative late blight resistance protein homolog R1C-3 [Coffea arabica]|uniref:Late blight resistance protein homolog R1C-3 n=1 Tax=Coffea arabica TaxID=13443 RepID=A0A6P6TVS6_COFAR|nr:putative late blight resistance protein homolog R1B-17 [Coffea arabica]
MDFKTCICSILDKLQLVMEKRYFCQPHHVLEVHYLTVELRLVKTFVLCSRRLAYSSRVEDSVHGEAYKFHKLLLRSEDGLPPSDLAAAVSGFRETLMDCKHKISEAYVEMLELVTQSVARARIRPSTREYEPWNLLDRLVKPSFSSADEFMEFFDSLLENLEDVMERSSVYYKQDIMERSSGYYEQLETLQEKLVSINNLIHFARLRGNPPGVVKKHCRAVVLSAAHLCYIYLFLKDDNQAFHELKLKITESVENIKHVYQQVRLAYFGVLQSGSSSLILSTQTDTFIVGNFVSSLLANLFELLLNSPSCFNRSLKHHLKILYEGLQFLSIILQKQQEKYDGLPGRTKDLIGAVVEDAAIVIFSLYQEEIREASAKETDVKLFCLLYKIKLIKAEVEEQHPVDLRFNFPTTSELGFIDLLLQKLKELASSKVDPLAFARDGAGFLKTYLKKTEEDSRRSLKQEVPKGLRLPWLNEMEQHELQDKLQLQRLKKDISLLRSFLKNYLEQHSRKDNLNLQTMQDSLLFLRSWLENHGEQCNQHKELQFLWSRVIELAYEAEFVFDSLIVGDISFYSLILFDKITQKVKLLKGEALKIHHKKYVFKALTAITSCLNCSPATRSKWSGTNKELSTDSAAQIEAVVGLNEEVEAIINQLKGGSMQLDMLSIVGMPGIGKTTLAQKVYHDPSVTSHFHVRAWCCISQTYNKQDLLSKILACIDQKAQFSKVKENVLAERIRKNLKGKKYLIFLDDVWDIEAWHTLKISFPDDKNGSRILLTSRDHEITGNRHVVQLLTDEESWELLQTKVANAREEGYPPELNVLGRKIARNCKGLPLSIVIISGILAALDQAGWEEVLITLSSNIVCDTDQCKSILELSYIHLPDHLKRCLLYFGAFREDQAIPAQRLKWLWIAEGFVQKNEPKSPEEIAEGYIMALIKRSLVTVGKQRSLGGVKTCHIHDLLHVFCKGKAKDINFLQVSEAFDAPHHLRRLSYGSDLKYIAKSRIFFTVYAL